MDDLFTDALRQLLAAECTPRRVREIERGQAAGALWSALEESGFADALVGEARGGAGLGLADAFGLLELCGSYAVPVPLADTLLARALLADAGVERPPGSIALAQSSLRSDGQVLCPLVACGRVADWVLVQQDAGCLLLPVAQAESKPAVFPLDATLQWSAPAAAAGKRVPGAHDLLTLQAC